jgi:two-component system NtrC family sensor kinase
MGRLNALGLRTRIVITLAVVMVLFIFLTELSISQLVRITVSRHAKAAVTAQDDAQSDAVDAKFKEDLLLLRRLVLFYMIFGAALAIALGSWAVTQLVVRPLGRITKAVEQVAQGKLETEVPIAGSGELIRLGAAFNRMTATIREQQEELRSRLVELEKSSADLKSVQDRLIRAAKLASVGTLAAGVAHEIGNPIAGVLGLLDALHEEADEEKSRHYRELIGKEIRRIDRIINDLVVYARPVRPEGVDVGFTELKEVFEHVRALLGAQKLFDRVKIEADLSGGPWTVSISRDDLTQVLINLFLNSAQAMQGEGIINLTVDRADGWRAGLSVVSREAIRITVTDNGPGIPDEYADRIFDPFFSKKGKTEGSGLGLAICQSICERAGGEIVLDRGHSPSTGFLITLLSR